MPRVEPGQSLAHQHEFNVTYHGLTSETMDYRLDRLVSVGGKNYGNSQALALHRPLIGFVRPRNVVGRIRRRCMSRSSAGYRASLRRDDSYIPMTLLERLRLGLQPDHAVRSRYPSVCAVLGADANAHGH